MSKTKGLISENYFEVGIPTAKKKDRFHMKIFTMSPNFEDFN